MLLEVFALWSGSSLPVQLRSVASLVESVRNDAAFARRNTSSAAGKKVKHERAAISNAPSRASPVSSLLPVAGSIGCLPPLQIAKNLHGRTFSLGQPS